MRGSRAKQIRRYIDKAIENGTISSDESKIMPYVNYKVKQVPNPNPKKAPSRFTMMGDCKRRLYKMAKKTYNTQVRSAT